MTNQGVKIQLPSGGQFSVAVDNRVIGANGSLTGYGGGLERKRALLELEQQGRVIAGDEVAQSISGISARASR
jgi:6-O-methylguanine DNA methyltransferase, DNA binding domain